MTAPSRRTALTAFLAAGLGGSGLAACGGVPAPGRPTIPTPSPAAGAEADEGGPDHLDDDLADGLGASGSSALTWTPDRPLPRGDTSRDVTVLLSPHPDDETLSMGVWAANAARHGHRVVVVCLTDGRSTGARATIGRRLGRPFTRDEVAAARVAELRDATSHLGVAPDDVVLAHLDGDATSGGSRLTVAEASAVIRVVSQRFPNAMYLTMSDVADRHPDHVNAGRALHQAMADGTVRYGAFAISRLWWHLPSPPVTVVLPEAAAVSERVRSAARAYDLWDPSHARFAVGWTSVHTQFVDLEADPRDHLHPWRPTD